MTSPVGKRKTASSPVPSAKPRTPGLPAIVVTAPTSKRPRSQDKRDQTMKWDPGKAKGTHFPRNTANPDMQNGRVGTRPQHTKQGGQHERGRSRLSRSMRRTQWFSQSLMYSLPTRATTNKQQATSFMISVTTGQ